MAKKSNNNAKSKKPSGSSSRDRAQTSPGADRKVVSKAGAAERTKIRSSQKFQEKPDQGPIPEKGMPQVTLQASRRFWLLFLGSALAILLLVQGYGYFTGWGNPQKVIQRQFNTAQRLTLAKRYQAAIRKYRKIIKATDDMEITRQATIALADLYREQKNWEKAIALYQQLQVGDTGAVMSAWTGLKIAECQHESGNSEEAIKTYQNIRNEFPSSDWDAEARLGIGKVLLDQEKYQESIAMHQSLEKDYQGGFLGAEALVRISECYAKLGNIESARKTLQYVVEAYPSTMTDEAKKYLRRMDSSNQPEGVRMWGE